jgi:hypothetical protein
MGQGGDEGMVGGQEGSGRRERYRPRGAFGSARSTGNPPQPPPPTLQTRFERTLQQIEAENQVALQKAKADSQTALQQAETDHQAALQEVRAESDRKIMSLYAEKLALG